jgi:BioD-like phosphotransacetylase family protein
VWSNAIANYLIHLKDNALVITPGDRADIILGALQANVSSVNGKCCSEDNILK